MKKMKKFDVLVKMKIVIACKKKIKIHYPWWIVGYLSLLDSRLWNKENGDHMWNEGDGEVWCSLDENCSRMTPVQKW